MLWKIIPRFRGADPKSIQKSSLAQFCLKADFLASSKINLFLKCFAEQKKKPFCGENV